jgi:Protein of unknown function (DUF2752)
VAPGRQLGLIWGGVAAALVAAAPFGPRLAGGLPACPFHLLTGLPCPTCGATRAALALARFDLGGAFLVSPLAALGWIALVGGGLVAGAAALAGFGVPEAPARLPLWVRAAAIAVVLANWAYLVWSGA